MTADFTILDVHHTGITVHDIEASIAFWRDVLGFKLLYRTRSDGPFAAEVTGVPGAAMEMAMLLASNHKVELLQYVEPADRAHLRPRPCDIGSVHVAFDVDDLDAALAHIARHDWRAVGTPQVIAQGPRKGTRVVYMHDPDGTTIELMQPPVA